MRDRKGAIRRAHLRLGVDLFGGQAKTLRAHWGRQHRIPARLYCIQVNPILRAFGAGYARLDSTHI